MIIFKDCKGRPIDPKQGLSDIPLALINHQESEIERLNKQVGMLRDHVIGNKNLAGLMVNGNSLSDIATKLLTCSESEWLSAHDQQVRDKALEDAISGCLRVLEKEAGYEMTDESVYLMVLHTFIEREIRAMEALRRQVS